VKPTLPLVPSSEFGSYSPTRDLFEIKYPIVTWTSALPQNSTLLIVAQSLFVMTTKPEVIRKAIERGAHLELCITDPSICGPGKLPERISGLVVSDIHSAVTVLKTQIRDWVKQAKPTGTVELRYHPLPFIDSYLELKSPDLSVLSAAVWDISFGRSLTDKMILYLDPNELLGKNLSARYRGFGTRPRIPWYSSTTERKSRSISSMGKPVQSQLHDLTNVFVALGGRVTGRLRLSRDRRSRKSKTNAR